MYSTHNCQVIYGENMTPFLKGWLKQAHFSGLSEGSVNLPSWEIVVVFGRKFLKLAKNEHIQRPCLCDQMLQ